MMDFARTADRELFFTADHEWIEFQGSIASIGICSFKLLGFRGIEFFVFFEPIGWFIKKGELIATIKYKDYVIGAHMPVDGKLIRVNESLVAGEGDMLLRHPEDMGWIALIAPLQPCERQGLLLPEQYKAPGENQVIKKSKVLPKYGITGTKNKRIDCPHRFG